MELQVWGTPARVQVSDMVRDASTVTQDVLRKTGRMFILIQVEGDLAYAYDCVVFVIEESPESRRNRRLTVRRTCTCTGSPKITRRESRDGADGCGWIT